MPDLIEPTRDEQRNGWDAKSLAAYVEDRKKAIESDADPRRVEDRPDPTPDEIRNGWTQRALGEYLDKRRAEQTQALDFQSRPQPKPSVANSRYQPKRWRG